MSSSSSKTTSKTTTEYSVLSTSVQEKSSDNETTNSVVGDASSPKVTDGAGYQWKKNPHLLYIGNQLIEAQKLKVINLNKSKYLPIVVANDKKAFNHTMDAVSTVITVNTSAAINLVYDYLNSNYNPSASPVCIVSPFDINLGTNMSEFPRTEILTLSTFYSHIYDLVRYGKLNSNVSDDRLGVVTGSGIFSQYIKYRDWEQTRDISKFD